MARKGSPVSQRNTVVKKGRVAGGLAGPTRRTPTENRIRKIEERRQQIFSGALQCFEQKGYHETTINDLANAAGVSAGLIYQYFTDKRDVLFQVILEILEAYNRDVPRATVGISDALMRFQAASIAYYNVIDKRIDATLMAYRETKLLDRDQIKILKAKELQTNRLIQDRIQECIDAGLCNEIDSELTAYAVITSAHMWALKNWRLRELCSHKQYIARSLSMILNDMLNDKGKAHLEANSLIR